MRRFLFVFATLIPSAFSAVATDASKEFAESIRPVLAENCGTCHSPKNPKNPANFLRASTAADMETNRSLWRDVAAQLRNRTMPPVATKLTEQDRLRVSSWIDNQLRQTACNAGDFAGPAVVRRLNRREYHNTIRDLLGIDFDVSAIFPADGTGGAGFDTNGETLYIPPLLMERYMEAAQQILDRVLITPPLLRNFTAHEMLPSPAPAAGAAETVRTLAPGEAISVTIPIYLEGDYDIRAFVTRQDVPAKVELRVDGAEMGELKAQQRGFGGTAFLGLSRKGPRPAVEALQIHLGRGTRTIAVAPAPDSSAGVLGLSIEEKREEPSPERKAVHYRLLGSEPGDEPLQPRNAARHVIAAFLPKAFRRPVQPAEVDRFMALYDRAAERGDPYEERVKLALRAVLVWPDFLFRIEHRDQTPGIHPLSQYELATRLSYFLWSTVPDEELIGLAQQGRLQDPKVLSEQVDRMLDDPRAHTFTTTFIGQWLGTQDVGGRVVPLLTEILSFYNPEVAADLRAQPVMMLDRMVAENRSLLDILNADYTYLTARLVKFYQLEDQFPKITDNHFHLVKWPDERRGGVLGLGAVLAMTSHYQQTSPVLRGAWALDTLLGTPVPPPPPGVPPLDAGDKVHTTLSTRDRILEHRANPQCSACHRLMDPIGFGLENFDWMGRWREKETNGQPINATGELPSGAKFDGPVELRQALLGQKDEFVRHVTGKVLGYALGRALQDGDSCTVQRMVDRLAADNYKTRTLIRQVVLSTPFRNTQGGDLKSAPVEVTHLNISSVTAKSQDAKNH
jgi:cytochrome c553